MNIGSKWLAWGLGGALGVAAADAVPGQASADGGVSANDLRVLPGRASGQARDVAVDASGNAYLVGGTAARDFPRTIGPEHQGDHDVFVAKLDPHGALLWARLLGGPKYERAYAVEVDREGFVYVGGRAGEGYPTTAGALQTRFAGDDYPNKKYGKQDGFVTKLSADGAIVWSTFFGGKDAGILRDIDVDAAGQTYLAYGGCRLPNPHVTSGALASSHPGGNCGLVAKLSAAGDRVVWATYLGGSDGETSLSTPSIRVHSDDTVVVTGPTASARMPVTERAFDRELSGRTDMYVARLTADGAGLIFGAYLGGSGAEFGDTHNLALTAAGEVVVAGTTKSEDFPVTPGALQQRFAGGGGQYNQTGDGFITRLAADGSRILQSTYLGGRSGDGIEGVVVDAEGRVAVSMGTYSMDLPLAGGGQRCAPLREDCPDGYSALLRADLGGLLQAGYFGGSDWDLGLALALGPGGERIVVGETCSGESGEKNPFVLWVR